jgi:hypothetical protein
MTVNVTLTFPEALVEQIDRTRGVANRSRYVVMLIEYAYRVQQQEHKDKDEEGSLLYTNPGGQSADLAQMYRKAGL